MHPTTITRGTPRPGASAHLTSRRKDLSLPNSSWGELSINLKIHVLSVGRIETDRLICDALLNSPEFRISFVHDYRDLWTSSKQNVVDAVVMHNTLCSFELAEAARLVRNRWPHAKILIIRSGEVSLDRALYDQRLHPPVTPDALVDHVRLVTGSLREGDNSGDR